MIKITLPIPPTSNRCFTNMRGSNGKRRVLTREARDYKQVARDTAWVAGVEQGWKYAGERLSVYVAFYFGSKRRRDLANVEKLLIDAVAEGLGFDDSVIDSLTLERRATNEPSPHCNVRIVEYQPNA